MNKISVLGMFVVINSFSAALWAESVTGEIQSIDQHKNQLKIAGNIYRLPEKLTASMLNNETDLIPVDNIVPGMLVEVTFDIGSGKSYPTVSGIKLLIH